MTHTSGNGMVSTRNSTKTTPGNTPRKATSRKVKNKVGSPPIRSPLGPVVALDEDEVESDDYNVNDEEDSLQVAAPSDSDSVSSEQRQRLPINLQRQLLADIEAKGGINAFTADSGQSLATLCDQRKQLYGERGDPLRRRIGRKVARWKLLTTEKYLKLLLKFGVTEAIVGTVVTESIESELKPAAKPSSKPAPTPKPDPYPTREPVPAPVPAPVPIVQQAVSSLASVDSSVSIPTAITFSTVPVPTPKGKNMTTIATTGTMDLVLLPSLLFVG